MKTSARMARAMFRDMTVERLLDLLAKGAPTDVAHALWEAGRKAEQLSEMLDAAAEAEERAEAVAKTMPLKRGKQ